MSDLAPGDLEALDSRQPEPTLRRVVPLPAVLLAVPSHRSRWGWGCQAPRRGRRASRTVGSAVPSRPGPSRGRCARPSAVPLTAQVRRSGVLPRNLCRFRCWATASTQISPGGAGRVFRGRVAGARPPEIWTEVASCRQVRSMFRAPTRNLRRFRPYRGAFDANLSESRCPPTETTQISGVNPRTAHLAGQGDGRRPSAAAP